MTKRSVSLPKGPWLPELAMKVSGVTPEAGELGRAAKSFILSLPEEKLTYRYRADKWTINEILVHIVDDERIYSYRALRFARNDFPTHR